METTWKNKLTGKRILLIISGGIAAYKSLELIRLLKKSGADVCCVLTNGGAQFVTPLSVAAISEEQVFTDLFSLKDETEMGHIRLSREADLVLVAPASANIIGQMAYGLAEDLASTTLLATNKPAMIAPAMNPMMWNNKATQDNIETLRKRGIQFVGPNAGEMACGETGVGRMSEPEEIMAAVCGFFENYKPLSGLSALVTSGPTYEAIDPVRFIGNRSSGKQGHAIAKALRDQGAAVTLVTGPVSLPDPEGIKTVHVESARDMLAACKEALPSDITVCAAAVSDWRIDGKANQKIKKNQVGAPTFSMVENPDILKTISTGSNRPTLVIGFAAETEDLIDNAKKKLRKKGCDWVIANNVTHNKTKGSIFGADQNHVFLISHDDKEEWPVMDKKAVATAIVDKIAAHFSEDMLNKAAE